jgi:NAD(P)-dependent dehydrogenase (short-subunit alcohol dehydrogenase family)
MSRPTAGKLAGAAGGIGLAIAAAFASAGMRIACLRRGKAGS